MSYKQINDPVYEVSCDRCRKDDVIPGEWKAFQKGYKKITLTSSGFIMIGDLQATSVIIWLCTECNHDFSKTIEQYFDLLVHPKGE